MRHLTIFSLMLLILATFSCKKAREQAAKEFQKTARGEADEMVLVVDSAIYSSDLVGSELKKTFGDFLLGLPQDERKFNVHTVNPRELNTTLKTAVNMVFVMTLDGTSSQSKAARGYFSDNSLKLIRDDSSIFMTVRKDEFAKGQVVLYLFGQNEQILAEKIKYNRAVLQEVFESAIRERTRISVLSQLEKASMKAIQEGHGYGIKIPYGWDVAKNLKDFVWLRKLEAQSEWNIFIHEQPYIDQSVFNNVALLRDEITETFLNDAENPQVHITRQAQINMFTKRVNFNGLFAVEARGLWKISDNSAGGPYVSYTIVDEETQKLYYIEGYVYSPGTKKKKMVREVESILSTFRTPSQQKKSK